jgi:hypothetical protein
MNKIKQILIGASLVALSGNAAAMMINIDGTEYSSNIKSLLPVIERIVNNEQEIPITDRQLEKLTGLHQKYDRVTNRLALAKGGERMKKFNQLKPIRVSTWRAIKVNMSTWGHAGLPGSVSNLENLIAGVGEGGGNGSVPEPSTIALLGLGLVGIGAARRLRKKAH